MNESVRDWVSFWDQPHSIYVNARHFDVHYRDIADAIVGLLPNPQSRVMDYGCGEAVHAERVAESAAQVLLCESSTSVRSRLTQRFAHNPKIKVLAPAEAEQLADASLDLIVANSMAQYVSAAELDRLLAVWRRLLAHDGILVVGDVIPPNVGALTDVVALLRYAARHGFLLPALRGLLRTAFSPYRKLRAKLGVTCYGETEFLAKLTRAGLAAERLAFNLEHNPARMSFRARRRN